MAILFFYCEKAKNIIKNKKGEFGVGSLLSVAVALIVCAFVLVPGLRAFSQTIVTAINTWWTGTVSGTVFPTA